MEPWPHVRHEIRNLLNAIKLSCAVVNRRPDNQALVRECMQEIERCTDAINAIITRYNAHPQQPQAPRPVSAG